MFSLRQKEFEIFSNALRLTNPNLKNDSLTRLASFIQSYEKSGFAKRDLEVLMELLHLSNLDVDIPYVSKLATLIKAHQAPFSEGKEMDVFFKTLQHCEKEVDLKYVSRFANLLESDEIPDDFQDSLSLNQFLSKWSLIDAIASHVPLGRDSTIMIWGCWYGSILIPYFQNKVGKIIGIDKNDEPIRLAKNKLFFDSPNVDLITDDIFSKYRNFYLETDLIINTSCEHMAPMKDWHWFGHGALITDRDNAPTKKRVFNSPKVSADCHFAFQSNNMTGIEGHINCVGSMGEFRDQLPDRTEVLFEDTIEDDRGLRFMIIGKFV